MYPDDVAGHQVGRTLHPLEFPSQGPRERLRQQGLPQARDSLHQDVAACDECHDEGTNRGLRADHDAAELTRQQAFQLLNTGAHDSILTIKLCSASNGTRRDAQASWCQSRSWRTSAAATE